MYVSYLRRDSRARSSQTTLNIQAWSEGWWLSLLGVVFFFLIFLYAAQCVILCCISCVHLQRFTFVVVKIINRQGVALFFNIKQGVEPLYTAFGHIIKRPSLGEFYPDDGRFIFWPEAWSFYNFLLKINKMLPLFNFCIKVFVRIETFPSARFTWN